jgi:hypothetical protein
MASVPKSPSKKIPNISIKFRIRFKEIPAKYLIWSSLDKKEIENLTVSKKPLSDRCNDDLFTGLQFGLLVQ